MNEKIKKGNVSVDIEVRKKLKIKAAELGVTMTELLEDILKKELKNYGRSRNK